MIIRKQHVNHIFTVLLIFYYSEKLAFCKTIKVSLSSKKAQQFGGQVITTFTFTNGGQSGVSYKLSSQWKVIPRLYVFPYDTDSPLPLTHDLVSPESCKAFFEKAMQLVELRNLSGHSNLGHFSGPFPITIVYADQLTCPPLTKKPKSLNMENAEQSNLELPSLKDKSEAKSPSQLPKEGNEELLCELQLLNADRFGEPTEHLSAEETGLVGFFRFLCLAYFLLGCICLPKVWAGLSKPGPMQMVLQLTTLVAGLQFFSAFFFLVHLDRYSTYGVGCTSCEVLAELLDIACHYLLLLLIVSWTLAGRQQVKLPWTDTTGKAIASLAAVQILYFLWSEVLGSARDGAQLWERDLHMFRNGLGLGSSHVGLVTALLFLVRLGLASVFALHLLKVSKKERSAIKRDFYATFAFISLLWFLCYPVFCVLGMIASDYLRYKFVTVGVSLCQAGALVLFYKLFLSRSLFWEISTLSGSLPIVMKFDKTYGGMKASP